MEEWGEYFAEINSAEDCSTDQSESEVIHTKNTNGLFSDASSSANSSEGEYNTQLSGENIGRRSNTIEISEPRSNLFGFPSDLTPLSKRGEFDSKSEIKDLPGTEVVPEPQTDVSLISKYKEGYLNDAKEMFALYYGNSSSVGDNEQNFKNFTKLVQYYFHHGEGKINTKHKDFVDSWDIKRNDNTLSGELIKMYHDYTQWEVLDISNLASYDGTVYDDETILQLSKLTGESKELAQSEINALSNHIKDNSNYNKSIMTDIVNRKEKSQVALSLFNYKSMFYREKTKSHANLIEFSYQHSKLLKEVDRLENLIKVTMGICLGKHLTLETWEEYLENSNLYQTDGDGNIVKHALLDSKDAYKDSLKLTYLNYISDEMGSKLLEEREESTAMTLKYLTKDLTKIKLVTDYLNRLDAINKLKSGVSKTTSISAIDLSQDDIDAVCSIIKIQTNNKLQEIETELERLSESIIGGKEVIEEKTPCLGAKINLEERVANIGSKEDEARMYEILFGKNDNEGVFVEKARQEKWKKVIVKEGVIFDVFIEDSEGFQESLISTFDKYSDNLVDLYSTDLYAEILIKGLDTMDADGDGEKNIEEKITTLKSYKYHLTMLKSMLNTIDENLDEVALDKELSVIYELEEKSKGDVLSASTEKSVKKSLDRKKEKIYNTIVKMHQSKTDANKIIKNNGKILIDDVLEAFSGNIRYGIMKKKKELLEVAQEGGLVFATKYFLTKVGNSNEYSFYEPPGFNEFNEMSETIALGEKRHSIGEWESFFSSDDNDIILTADYINAFFASRINQIYQEIEDDILSKYKAIEGSGEGFIKNNQSFGVRSLGLTAISILGAFAIIAGSHYVALSTEHVKNSLAFTTAYWLQPFGLGTYVGMEDKSAEDKAPIDKKEPDFKRANVVFSSSDSGQILNECFKLESVNDAELGEYQKVVLNPVGCGVDAASVNEKYPIGGGEGVDVIGKSLVKAFEACKSNADKTAFDDGLMSLKMIMSELKKTSNEYSGISEISASDRNGYLKFVDLATKDILETFMKIGVKDIGNQGEWGPYMEKSGSAFKFFETSQIKSSEGSGNDSENTTAADRRMDISPYDSFLYTFSDNGDLVQAPIDTDVKMVKTHVIVNDNDGAVSQFNNLFKKENGKWQLERRDDAFKNTETFQRTYDEISELFKNFGNSKHNGKLRPGVNINKDLVMGYIKINRSGANDNDIKTSFDNMINQLIFSYGLDNEGYDRRYTKIKYSNPVDGESYKILSQDVIKDILEDVNEGSATTLPNKGGSNNSDAVPQATSGDPNVLDAFNKKAVFSIFTNSISQNMKNNKHMDPSGKDKMNYFKLQNLIRSEVCEKLSGSMGGQFESNLIYLLASDEKMGMEQAKSLNIKRFKNMISMLVDGNPSTDAYEDLDSSQPWDKWDSANMVLGALSTLFLTSGFSYSAAVVGISVSGINIVARSNWFRPWKTKILETTLNTTTKIALWLMDLFTSTFTLRMAFQNSTSILITVVSMFYVCTTVLPIFNLEADGELSPLGYSQWNISEAFEDGSLHGFSELTKTFLTSYATAGVSYIALKKTYANFAIWWEKLKQTGRLYTGLKSESYFTYNPLYILSILGINLATAPADFLMNVNTMIHVVSTTSLYFMKMPVERDGVSIFQHNLLPSNELTLLGANLALLMILQSKNTLSYLNSLSESGKTDKPIKFDERRNIDNPMARYNAYAERTDSTSKNPVINLLDSIFYVFPNMVGKVLFKEPLDYSDEGLVHRLNDMIEKLANKNLIAEEAANKAARRAEFKKMNPDLTNEELESNLRYYSLSPQQKAARKEIIKKGLFIRIQMIVSTLSGFVNTMLTSWNSQIFEGFYSQFQNLSGIAQDENATINDTGVFFSNIVGDTALSSEEMNVLDKVAKSISDFPVVPQIMKPLDTKYSMAWWTWKWLLKSPLEHLLTITNSIGGNIYPTASINSLYDKALTYTMNPFGSSSWGMFPESARFVVMLIVYGGTLLPLTRLVYDPFKTWEENKAHYNSMLESRLKKELEGDDVGLEKLQELQQRQLKLLTP